MKNASPIVVPTIDLKTVLLPQKSLDQRLECRNRCYDELALSSSESTSHGKLVHFHQF